MRQIVEDGTGQKWSFDGQRMEGLLRNAAYLRASLVNSQVTTSRDSFIQKIRLATPLAEVTQNLKQIDGTKARYFDQYSAEILQLKVGGWEDLQRYLARKRAQVEQDKAAVNGMFRSAQDINRAAIESAETGIMVARGVRDASVVSLGIVATVSTGGLTYVAAGVAGAGKGAATFQDTGNWTKAIADGAFVAIPLGAGRYLKGAQAAGQISKGVVTATTLVIDIGAEVGTDLVVNEKDLESAMVNALLKQGVGMLETEALAPIKTEIGRSIRDTIVIMNDKSGTGSNRVTPLVAETVKKLGNAAGEMIMQRPSAGDNALTAMSAMCMANPASVPVPLAPMQWIQAHVLRRA